MGWKGNFESLDTYMKGLKDPKKSKFYPEWSGGQNLTLHKIKDNSTSEKEINDIASQCLSVAYLSDKERIKIKEARLQLVDDPRVAPDLRRRLKVIVDSDKSEENQLLIKKYKQESPQIREEYCSAIAGECADFLESEDPKLEDFNSYYHYMKYLSEIVEYFYQEPDLEQAEIDFIADEYRLLAVDYGYCTKQDWEDYYSNKDLSGRVPPKENSEK